MHRSTTDGWMHLNENILILVIITVILVMIKVIIPIVRIKVIIVSIVRIKVIIITIVRVKVISLNESEIRCCAHSSVCFITFILSLKVKFFHKSFAFLFVLSLLYPL